MTAAQTAPAAATVLTGPADTRRSRRAAHARPADGQQPAARSDRSRTRTRHLAPRTVRARIVCLLALPVVSLTSLWGIAAVDTISAAYNQAQLRTMDSAVAMPLDDAVTAVQQERSATVAYLATPDADPSALDARIAATRVALGTLRAGADQSAAAAANLGASFSARLTATTNAMDALIPLRTEILARAVTTSDAERAYDAAIDDAFAVQTALADAPGAPVTAQPALALTEAREQLAAQDAVLAAAHAAGTLSVSGYQQFTGAVYAERAYLVQAGATLPDPTASTAGATLAGLQDAVVTAGPGSAGASAASPLTWNAAAPTVLADLDSAARAASTPASADPYRQLLTTGSGFGVLLGLFALVVSLLISVGIGRRLVTDLVGLRDYALDLAGRRLPETMARLRAGQVVEPGEQAPPLDPDAGELGQVADALAVASRAAMQAAVERAELVSGVSGVFLNLARRSQVLVHRQLAMLDAMERRIEEPDHLEDLFRLDHLATRMRRHAEGLIILSGATPGRAWRHPVDLTDVVRAAAAEAEDYHRVEVRRMPQARVLGPVVADLTHLLAELIENATSFSPPHTRVVVGGEPVGSGFAIEIEDRGLGMSPDALREANRRIGESSGDDLFDSDRLGLFVVSRLARRHEVRVSLCASAYGGITAVVLIPSNVMQGPGASDIPPAEHDLGVSGAMPHGPISTTSAAADLTAADGPGPRIWNEPVFEPFAQPHEAAPSSAAASGIPQPLDSRPVDRPLTADQSSALDQAPTSDQPQAPVTHTNGHAHHGEDLLPHTFEGLTPSQGGATRSERRRPEGAGETQKAGPATYSPLGRDGLPRRVRQASLAPQLRPQPPGETDAPEAGGASGRDTRSPRPPRTPEQNRATMTAFQQGFTRGRTEEPAAPPHTAAAPATSSGSRTAEGQAAGQPAADHDERGDGPR